MDPEAALQMDVALADLVHSRLDSFNFAKDPKMQHVLHNARRPPLTYESPGADKMGGELLSHLYEIHQTQE